MRDSMELNRIGKLSRSQQVYLLSQFFKRASFVFVWLLLVWMFDWNESRLIGNQVASISFITYALKAAGVVGLGYYACIYSLDMLLEKPVQAIGKLQKYQRRVGRSDQYWVNIDSHRAMTTKQIWLALEPKNSYELFYGKWTKQLLAYHPMPS